MSGGSETKNLAATMAASFSSTSMIRERRRKTTTATTANSAPLQPRRRHLQAVLHLLTRTSRILSLLLLFILVLLLQARLSSSQECSNNDNNNDNQDGDGVCSLWNSDPITSCELWLAESIVSPGSLGVFAGRAYSNDEALSPDLQDVAINVIDYNPSQDDDSTSFVSPLAPYLWNAYHTYSTFDANQVDAVLPGLGMLVQHHHLLSNMELDHEHLNRTRLSVGNDATAVGALTHVQSVQFRTTRSVEVGQELLIDPVFRFGPERYQQLLQKQQQVLQDSGSTTTTAVRSLMDLQQHGVCLDDQLLRVQPSRFVPYQNGAFVKRPVKQGHLISTIPLLALDRQADLKILGHSTKQQQQHDQLLLNYGYSHSESSIVLFPMAPVVNLVNHHHQHANVALRWATTASGWFHNDTLLQLSPAQVRYEQQQKFTSSSSSSFRVPPPMLAMELYALRDLQANEEMLLDYGVEWQTAYDRHVHDWNVMMRMLDEDASRNRKKSAYDYEQDEEIYTQDEPLHYPDGSIQPRCFINVENLVRESPDDDEGWYEFVPTDGDLIDWTQPCHVLHADFDDDGNKESYRVVVERVVEAGDSSSVSTSEYYRVKQVPWSAITFVDQKYQGIQYHQRAFRHEIHLPDSIFPAAWKDRAPSSSNEICGLYMAESAIPNSGMGMYTARLIDEGERIFYGDVVIQVEDYGLNNHLRRAYHGIHNETPSSSWLLNSYYWDPSTTLAQHEAEDVQSIMPGLGMLANSHTGLVNAEQMEPNQMGYFLHRALDVGAGASSSYHDSHFDAEQDIVVGEEIFVRYGDAWFMERLENVPLQADFVKADVVVFRFWDVLVRKSTLRNANKRNEIAHDAWSLVRNLTQARHRLDSALPSFQDVEKVVETGTAAHSTPNRIRSLEWLEQNGRCLDNLRPGDSTILQAGKGAFATRRIAKGDVIAPMPVVQILRRDLEVYEATEAFDEDDEDTIDPTTIKYLGMQLLLNYCYGHKDSSLLLFPYSPVVNYLNHHSSQPNAKLQWSTLPGHRAEWLHRSPTDLAGKSHAGLVMELVALRDIQPGEEVFLDYGNDWSEKWQEFQLDWAPPEDATTYVSASMLNRRNEWLRTEEELETNPYPYDNVFTMCFVGRKRVKANAHSFEEDDDVYEWTHVDGIYEDTGNLYPCQVLERDIGDESLSEVMGRRESIAPLDVQYTVRVIEDEDDPEDPSYFVSVPRGAILFFDHQYTSDLFLRNAFRHEIHLPDEMVSKEWRDLAHSPS